MWREVDGVRFWRHLPRLESTRQQHAGAQTGLDSKVNRSKLCTETQSIKGHARTVDVGTAFEIIDRPPNILATLNTYFAQLTLSARPIGVALVCFLVNRVG